jgi:hypothetical protein
MTTQEFASAYLEKIQHDLQELDGAEVKDYREYILDIIYLLKRDVKSLSNIDPDGGN